MKNLYKIFTITFVLIQFTLEAQWIQRAGLGLNNTRSLSTAFSVNGKIYIVGGQDNSFTALNDVWEYNLATNTWIQKSDFPGGPRAGASAFTIGNLAYFVGGTNYAGQFFNDVWEYNSVTDTWTQKNDAPFLERSEAVGFTIGNLGYVGTGYSEIVGPNFTTEVTVNDFWQYNPTTDAWTMKAVVPGQPRAWAIGAEAGGRGYVGMGGDPGQTMSFNDFYEYDPAQNTWTTKTNSPLALADAGVFSWNNEVYVCGGINFNSMSGTASFRKYIPSTNTWSAMPSFSGGLIMAPVSATMANRAFLGTGYDLNLDVRQDWWEFEIPSNCAGPINFGTSTVSTNALQPCNGKIILANITNACTPFTVSILPNTGTIQTGASSATLTGLCAGSYSVKVTDNNCCGSAQKVCIVSAALATDVNENTGDVLSINIAPNPNNGSFRLDMSGRAEVQVSKLSIMDVIGRQIVFKTSPNGNGLEIQLPEAAKGIYFLNYSMPHGTITKKFIVD